MGAWERNGAKDNPTSMNNETKGCEGTNFLMLEAKAAQMGNASAWLIA